MFFYLCVRICVCLCGCTRCRRLLTSRGPLAPQGLLVWTMIDSCSSYICLCMCVCVCVREYGSAAEDSDCALAIPDESNLYLLTCSEALQGLMKSSKGETSERKYSKVKPTAGWFLYNTPLSFFSVWTKSSEKMTGRSEKRVIMYSERKKETLCCNSMKDTNK